MTDRDETLMEFPCEFPIKVMGKDTEAFRCVTLEIVQTHMGEQARTRVNERLSAGGKYLALTYTVTASSREQLDALYQALTNCEHVVMAL